MKNRNHDPVKEQNEVLENDLRETETYELPDKRFNLIALRRLDLLQENTEKTR